MIHTKFLQAVLLSLVILFFAPNLVFAKDLDFLIDSEAHFRITPNGVTNATFDVTITNAADYFQAQSFILELANVSPTDIKAFENGQLLPTTVERKDKRTLISVFFDTPIRGKGEKKSITIDFVDFSMASKTGDIWEVTIPKAEGDFFNSYTTKVTIPTSFGPLTYSSVPVDASNDENDSKTYSFTKDKTSAGMVLVFGEFQVFSFKLSYHLQNTNATKKDVQIAIPPDTATQKVFFEKIDPKPKNIIPDSDGNWIASYTLSPRQKLTVETTGTVQITSGGLPVAQVSPTTLVNNTQPTKYWQSDNPEIKNIAEKINTPRAIYDFVSQSLSYNYDRVTENVQRQGAADALKNPENAICMEFTDLFIALARSAGIPAREINGFSYSQNPKITPLSLVADVLHSWPEYWDSQKNVWIPVDPTWAATSGGLNFFDDFDLGHFVFVIHGLDDSYPLSPGFYKDDNPQKDVFVTFGVLPQDRAAQVGVTIENQGVFSLLTKKITVMVQNTGSAASYNDVLVVETNGLERPYSIPQLPPFSFVVMPLTLSYGILGTTSDIYKIRLNGNEVELPDFRVNIIVNQMLVISLTLLLVVGFVCRQSLKKLFLSTLGIGRN